MIDPGEFHAMRRFWCAVVMTEFTDSWKALEAGKDPERIRAKALRYFDSAKGRHDLACAGIEASTEQLAAVCIDPTARDRIKSLEDLQ